MSTTSIQFSDKKLLEKEMFSFKFNLHFEAH